LDKIKCKDKCLCHSLFTMKYKELVHVIKYITKVVQGV